MDEDEKCERAAEIREEWRRRGISGDNVYWLCDELISALDEAKAASDGVALIARERERHVGLGWTAGHDDEHDRGDLAIVAAQLAVHGTDASVECPHEIWEGLDNGKDPWGLIDKHCENEVRQLTVAGALIAAEIDRLQRQERDR